MPSLNDLAALAASGKIQVSPDRKFAGELLGLKDISTALGPMVDQPRGVNYYSGRYDERQWNDMMNNIHQSIQSGFATDEMIQRELGISKDEAERFMDYSLNPRNTQTRHQYIGVPHAYSSENVYRSMLNANPGMSADFNNVVDDRATDLVVNMGGRDQLVDVQNRTIASQAPDQDKISLGLRQGFKGNQSGLGRAVFSGADDSYSLNKIVDRIDSLTRGKIKHDKLGLDTRPGFHKDYLIGGKYLSGDVSNLLGPGQEAKGSYDFVRPREVDLIDMNRLRSDMGQMSKADLRHAGVKILRLDDKLKLGIPMSLVNQLGANRTDMIDPSLLQRIRR
jgi:hypothetical protein